LPRKLAIVNRAAFVTSTAAAVAMIAPLPSRAQASREGDIALTTPTGTIAGTLTLPAGGRAPVVLIVPGSGPVDRNGNTGPIRAGTYQLLAAALAARGIASVRYDKRGVGQSAGAMTAERDLRFDTYVEDVAAWLRLLRSDRRFTRVGVAGHSEGSLLGMVALQHAPGDAFVSLEGAGRPAPAVLREQLRPKLSPALYAKADAIIAQLQAGHQVADTPPELSALFRSSAQPYLISWFRYDPAVEISRVTVPATIVQGTADIQTTMADAGALKAGAPSATLIVVKGMNHMLKYAPDTSSLEVVMRSYEDPSLPVMPQAVEAITARVR
jgi:alpha-beta hydrolase superfamily lysophospholipase